MTRNKEIAYHTPLYESRPVQCPESRVLGLQGVFAEYMVGGEIKVSVVRHEKALPRSGFINLLLFRFLALTNLVYNILEFCQ